MSSTSFSPFQAWPEQGQDPLLRRSFDLLRSKWGEVPYTAQDRIKTADLLSLPDGEILRVWQHAYDTTASGDAYSVRGWYHELYQDSFVGKKMLDVGCGLSPSGVYFASHGAKLTFTDIVAENVEFVKRVCKLKHIDAQFLYMEDLGALVKLGSFDVIFCCGSFINMPLSLARVEAQALIQHLRTGGRWIELGYPKVRWEREGSLPFERWGDKTDGGAPWIEWHDLQKVRWMLAPVTFDVILDFEFHNSDFNWFDLIRTSKW